MARNIYVEELIHTPIEQQSSEIVERKGIGHPVGSISDKVIDNLILSGKDPKDLARIRVDEVMEPAFPQVDAKAPVELAASLLRHYNAVLVTAKGEVTGIVTKSDLMKLL